MDAQLEDVSLKARRRQSFGEAISNLVICGDRKQSDAALLNLLANQMTVKFNVLRSFMEHGILSNLDS